MQAYTSTAAAWRGTPRPLLCVRDTHSRRMLGDRSPSPQRARLVAEPSRRCWSCGRSLKLRRSRASRRHHPELGRSLLIARPKSRRCHVLSRARVFPSVSIWRTHDDDPDSRPRPAIRHDRGCGRRLRIRRHDRRGGRHLHQRLLLYWPLAHPPGGRRRGGDRRDRQSRRTARQSSPRACPARTS